MGNHNPAGPYSGGKYTVREGGTRTPFISYWKGRIKPNVSDLMISTIDLMASFSSLVGIELAKDSGLDSFNVLDAILGGSDAKGREYIVSQDNGKRGNYGLRVGNWKLQRHDSKIMYNGDLSMRTWPVPKYTLYDLSVDIEEKNDLSNQNKDIFEKLKNKLDTIINNGRTRS